jgi:polyphosphate kinase 2
MGTKDIELRPEDLEILNSPAGLKNLFAYPNVNVEWTLNRCAYDNELKSLQAEFVKLQEWVIRQEKKVVVLFEGRDAAGKGGAIRRMTAHINPRFFRIEALPKPTDEERGQWYFQRYVNRLPREGEMVFFDRSWYNRAVVEPVNAFCTAEEYEVFMGQINEFERMILESDIYLLKIYFSINKEEQAKRFEDIKSSPLKKWKMSVVDERAQELWDEYTKYKLRMFSHTDNEQAPWKIIKANKKTFARLEAIRYVLDSLPYKS